MNIEKIKLIKQLELIAGSKLEKVFEGAREGFAHYFSNFDIDGIDSLLSDYNNYDGVSKEYYVNLIKKEFNNLKREDVYSLKAIPGTCNNCIKGCKGFTFIDEKNGFFYDIIIEVKKSEITNFIECSDLKNEKEEPNKIERIIIKPYDFDNKNDDVPF
jgi:hypothetical protein